MSLTSTQQKRHQQEVRRQINERIAAEDRDLAAARKKADAERAEAAQAEEADDATADTFAAAAEALLARFYPRHRAACLVVHTGVFAAPPVIISVGGTGTIPANVKVPAHTSLGFDRDVELLDM